MTDKKQTRGKLKDARKEALFAELHSLLSAGLDFSRSFELLIAGEQEPATRALLKDLYGDVIRGESLGAAFEGSRRFSPLDCGVLRIGEETGRLDECLAFLGDYYRKKIEQRRMVSSALSYPLIVLCTAVAVVAFMVLVIVPMFEQVYARMGGELPAITRAIIRFSKHFPAYLVGTLLALGALGAVLIAGKENPTQQRMLSSLLLRLPLLGNILRKNIQARFCKLLYLLVGSGVPLLRSMEMLSGIVRFYPYRKSFGEICRGLNRGERFAEGMARHEELYGIKFITLARVGEETGRLSEMLRNQGNELTRELEHRLKLLGSLLEPILILGIGILVATILIAMYLPMFKLGSVMY